MPGLDQLQRDGALNRRFLLGQPHLPHPAFAEHSQESVRPDLAGALRGGRAAAQRAIESVGMKGLSSVVRRVVRVHGRGLRLQRISWIASGYCQGKRREAAVISQRSPAVGSAVKERPDRVRDIRPRVSSYFRLGRRGTVLRDALTWLARAETPGSKRRQTVIASRLRALTVVAALCLSPRAAADTSPVIVNAPAGAVRGEAHGASHVFKGIPFALPPTGARRWTPPQPVPPWTDVHDATRYGPACVQPPSRAESIYAWDLPAMSEDCLSLEHLGACAGAQCAGVRVDPRRRAHHRRRQPVAL